MFFDLAQRLFANVIPNSDTESLSILTNNLHVNKKIVPVFDIAWEDEITDVKISALGSEKAVGLERERGRKTKRFVPSQQVLLE